MRRLLLALLVLSVAACGEPPELYDTDRDEVPDAIDCAPNDPDVFPASPDPVDPDGLDSNCDGVDGVDGDGDGFASLGSGGDDCNDDDPDVWPGAPETPDDGVDGDCDGADLVCDADLDGATTTVTGCDGADCDDSNSLVHPGAEELCDGLDTDCSGSLPADEADADADGVSVCQGDCDDEAPHVLPAASEACDGLDTDCDGETPADESDVDGDASMPCSGDCADDDPSRHPGADEACDGLDTDCDGAAGADEVDGDSDGDPACSDCDDGVSAVSSLDVDGDGASSCDGDCADLDPGVHPALLDAWGDGVDADCDGLDGIDADGDGWAANRIPPDCDEVSGAAALTWPGAADEAGDGIDQGCDGVDGVDADGDGVASEASGGADCNDDPSDPLAPITLPGADDLVGNGADSDCDGIDGVDGDGDGVASVGSGGLDCNDDGADPVAADTWPGAPDDVGDGVDQSCDGVDGTDADGDGVASVASGGDDCGDDPADPIAALTWPGASDAWGDGQDTDCDGADGIDADSDGWAVNAGGAQDCDDTDPLVLPGSQATWESPGQGMDVDCDGVLGDFLVEADAVLLGESPDDRSGFAIAGGTDVDGDGLADVLVGAPEADPGGASSGQAWLCRGAEMSAGGALGLGSCHASFEGEQASDRAAGSVASPGDVDGDGLADVLVGVVRDDVGGTQAGSAAVFFGASIAAGGSWGLDDADVILVGEGSYNRAGYAVAAAGDVDGDGLADVFVGAPGNHDAGYGAGKAYLVFGSTIAGGGTFALGAADVAFVGGMPQETVGSALAAAGDVDGDGLADVMIGVQGSDEGGADSGRTAVFFGASIAGGGTFALSDADVTLLGAEADLSGRSVAGAGDVDGDGVPDLLIGGANLVAFGVSGADVLAGGTFDLDDVGTVFQASAAQGDVVLSVAAGGDLDGDGLEDLLITSANNLAVGLGKVCVFLGGGLLTGGVLSLEEADAVFYGTTGVAQLATGAGDVDGDGVDDVLVGSFSDHTAGSTAGATWVLFSPW